MEQGCTPVPARPVGQVSADNYVEHISPTWLLMKLSRAHAYARVITCAALPCGGFSFAEKSPVCTQKLLKITFAKNIFTCPIQGTLCHSTASSHQQYMGTGVARGLKLKSRDIW